MGTKVWIGREDLNRIMELRNFVIREFQHGDLAEVGGESFSVRDDYQILFARESKERPGVILVICYGIGADGFIEVKGQVDISSRYILPFEIDFEEWEIVDPCEDHIFDILKFRTENFGENHQELKRELLQAHPDWEVWD